MNTSLKIALTAFVITAGVIKGAPALAEAPAQNVSIVRTTDLPDRDAFKRWPEQPLDERRTELVFARAGLPASVD